MKIISNSIYLAFVAVVLPSLCILPQVQAVVPPPDGAYPNFTTAEGQNALQDLTSGAGNTALGAYSLFSTTTSSFNTAVGAAALDLNTGDLNTAVGVATLLLNTGSENTAVGVDALGLNTAGGSNAAVGAFALYKNTASDNTAIGDRAMFNNTTGDQNTAVGGTGIGGPALFSNTTGRFNTAVGGGTLSSNSDGGDNTAIGSGALQHNISGNENVAGGLNALNNSTGNNNVALGNYAGFAATTGSNNIYIGYMMEGTAGESNACYIGSIFGQTASNGGTPVYVDASNKLGTMTSSKRFKEDIKPMDKTSDALFSLKPVSFRYKKEIDPAGASQLGLVAEDVENVNPNLVVRDKEGKPYSVRYDQVNAMLLNEFLKEHKKMQGLEATVARQEAAIAKQQKDFQASAIRQQKQIDTLTAGLQKVSAQVELSKPVRQTVLNSR
jgi:hypothetical protein